MDNTKQLTIGDLVAIRGDLRRNLDGRCAYAPDQLAGGKFIKRAGSDVAWTGKVEAIDGDMAKVGGGWRGIERYELVMNQDMDNTRPAMPTQAR